MTVVNVSSQGISASYGYGVASVGAAPFAPILTSPGYGATSDLTDTTFSWTFLSPLGLGQGAYSIGFMLLSSGIYLWWNGTSLVSNQVYISSSDTSVTIPSGILLNGNSYSWVVGTADTNGVAGPNSTPGLVIGAPVPTVNVTGPTGTQAVGSVTLVWQNLNVQTVATYQVIVYTIAQTEAEGFVAGSSPYVWNSGVILGSSNSQALPNLPVGEFVAYVQITSSQGSASAWTPWDITFSYTAPEEPTLTATYDQTTQTTALVVVGHDTGGLVGNTTATVYRSSDGGSTWTAVSTFTALAVPSDNQTVDGTDYTPNLSQESGTTFADIYYYAVVTGPSGITSARSEEQEVTASFPSETGGVPSNGWNFLDATTYATNLQPMVTSFSQSQTIRGGLHMVLGNPEPVYLQDVTSSRTIKLEVTTVATTDWTDLKSMLETGDVLYVTNIYGLVGFFQLMPDGYSMDQSVGSAASSIRKTTFSLVETYVLPGEGAGT